LTLRIERLDLAPDMLGESPVWDPDAATLYWVDTVGRKVRSWHPASGRENAWTTPSMVGSIALAESDSLIVALQDGFYRLWLATKQVELLWRPEIVDAHTRFNDGKLDRSGRFLCGSMGIHAEPLGALYRMNRARTVDRLVDGIRISNSLCFSPGGDVMYFADSLSRAIWAYDYDADGDRIGARRTLIDTNQFDSGPDGATVDAEGYLWVALVRAGRLARISPQGDVDGIVDLPVDMPTCPAFGGPNLDTLFVTSIKDSGTGRAVSQHPDGGSVFALKDIGVRGLPEARFCIEGIQDRTIPR
jgi:sugar lactone lactonase YvrE